MSLRKKVNVSKFVKKFRAKYPTVPRDFLRKTIRLELEHQKVSFTEAISKKLDRELRKSFSRPLVDICKSSSSVVDSGSEEKIICEVLENYFPYGIDVHFQSKYTTSTDLFEQALREAAIRTGNDPQNSAFRERFYKKAKKGGQSNKQAT